MITVHAGLTRPNYPHSLSQHVLKGKVQCARFHEVEVARLQFDKKVQLVRLIKGLQISRLFVQSLLHAIAIPRDQNKFITAPELLDDHCSGAGCFEGV